jgi:hypothetical protein
MITIWLAPSPHPASIRPEVSLSLEPAVVGFRYVRFPGRPKLGPVCFGFWQLLVTKSCCGLPNAQLFRQLL